MQALCLIILMLGYCLALAYQGASLSVWTLLFGTTLVLYSVSGIAGLTALVVLWCLFVLVFLPLNVHWLRQRLLSKYALAFFRRMQPSMSRTEREALEAGSVGWEGELFAGRPDWQALLALPKPELTEEEQAFLDGPVEQLCRMTNNWDITHKLADLTPEIWQFLKTNGFFGLIIPKQYGGKGFSAYAHAAILIKVSGRSTTLATTITVPNSLGPAELILIYGTDKQKEYYLPRLARGEEIPCFALTGPDAGSDAAAIPDTGIVSKGFYAGKETLGIRLNWNKRYITLAPVATVLGLAFRLFDPEHLLGQVEDIGITCALIPTHLPGITIGRRHFPLNVSFQNGPTQGKDVFIPMDLIIGGVSQAGNGWRMLMECLAAGRALSLPSIALGSTKSLVAATSAYSRIRRQFGSPLGHFEGVEEVLARMGGFNYILNALSQLSVGQVASGHKPAVGAAIAKYHMTEMCRQVCIDAMDIHGGKGICLGPRNYIGRGYQSIPISITVEGANILTRSLIIFGQGAVRCHPYILKEILAGQETNEQMALQNFDQAIFAHLGLIGSNKVAAWLLGLTNGRLASVPNGVCQRYYQHFSRFSAAFGLLSNICLITIGGDLKRKEKISGRLGDILSYLYMGSAVLKQFHEDHEPAADLPFLDWSCQYILHQIEQQMNQVLLNMPNRFWAATLRCFIFPFGLQFNLPVDAIGKEIANILLSSNAARSRLISGIDLTPDGYNCVGNLESTFKKAIALAEVEKRVLKAHKEHKIHALQFAEMITQARTLGIITLEEATALEEFERERQEIIAVDDFETLELKLGK